MLVVSRLWTVDFSAKTFDSIIWDTVHSLAVLHLFYIVEYALDGWTSAWALPYLEMRVPQNYK